MTGFDTLIRHELGGLNGGLLIGATGGQQVDHRVVPLVTGILEEMIEGIRRVSLPHRQRDGNGMGIGLRVLNGEPVVDCVGIDQREALDETQRPAGSAVTGLEDVRRLEIGRRPACC